jgi:hypothetical protein
MAFTSRLGMTLALDLFNLRRFGGHAWPDVMWLRLCLGLCPGRPIAGAMFTGERHASEDRSNAIVSRSSHLILKGPPC